MMALRRATRVVAWWALRAMLWLLWAPTAFALKAVWLSAARSALGDTMKCGTCHGAISLLGLWACGGCGYSWHGWYFARCEVCGDVPPYVECGRCGATTMNPLI
jgi:hypothetical protein